MPSTALDDTVRQRLRLEIGRFRSRETRRLFDLSVHVGELGAERDSFVLRAQDEPAVDGALRTDVVSRLLEGSPDSWRVAWLVRPGSIEPHQEDPDWFAAARLAFGMHDRPLDGFFVLTRAGWRDVVSGDSQVWRRLRL